MQELPLTLIRQVTRRPRSATTETRSPFTGQEQVQNWGGGWWEFDLTFALHSGRDARRMEAFFAALEGPSTPFILRDPSVRQSLAATPTVSGAGQSGKTLATAGWTPSVTALQAGDFLQVGTVLPRLHIVTTDVVANGSGAATISIWPALREAPANASPVNIATPGLAVRLTASAPFEILRSVADKATFSVTVIEALNAT